jgi:hypothetical protein
MRASPADATAAQLRDVVVGQRSRPRRRVPGLVAGAADGRDERAWRSQICIPPPPKNPDGQTAPDEAAPSCVSTAMQFAVGVPSVNDVLTSCACVAAANVSVRNVAARRGFKSTPFVQSRRAHAWLSYTRRRTLRIEKTSPYGFFSALLPGRPRLSKGRSLKHEPSFGTDGARRFPLRAL